MWDDLVVRGGYGSSGPSLGERVGALPAGQTSGPVPGTSPARHCTVGGEPSLLVEWSRTEHGWEGRVVSVLWIDAVGWAVVERWVPAEEIEPR
jgi:hypothetical protein